MVRERFVILRGGPVLKQGFGGNLETAGAGGSGMQEQDFRHLGAPLPSQRGRPQAEDAARAGVSRGA